MYRLRKIESFDLPELQPYRTMRRQHEHREKGIFVAEGEKVVRRLLESKFSVVSVLLPEKWLTDLGPLLQSRPEDIEGFVAEKALLETLTGYRRRERWQSLRLRSRQYGQIRLRRQFDSVPGIA